MGYHPPHTDVFYAYTATGVRKHERCACPICLVPDFLRELAPELAHDERHLKLLPREKSKNISEYTSVVNYFQRAGFLPAAADAAAATDTATAATASGGGSIHLSH